MIYSSILDTIGHTPIVKLQRLAPRGVDLYVKVEAFNPMGSVKDRMALAVIEDAEQRGALRPGQTVIEATSGNTGIALAMVCAAKGYPFVATMAESFSVERRQIMRALGAKVVLTPAAEKASGMVRAAEALAARHGWFLPRQFDNPANPECHQRTTAVEIIEDFGERPLDYWVSGYGTGGTLTGTGKALKARWPGVRIVGCEPGAAPTLSGGQWQPHKIQGWTPDFLPRVLERSVVDEVQAVSDEEAREFSLRLAREEGIFAGLSAGATLAVAHRLACSAQRGAAILAMLPDTGERYLSTFLCENLAGGSDQVEPELPASGGSSAAA